MPRVDVRRVYDPGDERRGYRVLVDRLWPRGVAKADLTFDEWCKDAAPSTELRRWYRHDVSRFDEFVRRYRAELSDEPAAAALEHLAAVSARRHLTLLTATRDVDHSAAEVLRQQLLDRAAPRRRRRS
jgi:uncharacterized protein YeaO (DUF488 family)